MDAGTPIVEVMTAIERAQLTELEVTIERGLSTFNEVGKSLLTIRKQRLYRESHKTFEDYCQDRWGIQRAHAYRLIESAEVVQNLSPIGDILPSTESQARPLTQLEPQAQREVWQRAVETAPEGKVTAKHVERTVTEWKYDQGIEYPEPTTETRPLASDDDDTIKTVTLRVARVVYLLTLGRHMDLREISEKTGLTENGAWRMMERLSGGHHVPVAPDDDGKWCILKMDARDMAY